MPHLFCRKNILFYRKVISAILVVIFSLTMTVRPSYAQLLPNLPAPGQSIWLTPIFQPPVLRGMTVHPENPLLFDFIVDRGQDKINNDLLKVESTKLIKYFLASMTIPDKDAWVNLSPYEKDRIIPDALGQTEMGRQMLEQDYILKQLSASLTNPDKALGQKFWNEVKARAQKQFGTTDVPLSTFNKVWIVPDGATVVEKDGFAYITESKLKVMLDEDYVALEKNTAAQPQDQNNTVSKLSSDVFREMILPKLVEEVNTGKNFAQTRQVYQSVILAAWYKKALKDSLLGRIYADKSKVEGVESDVKDIKQKVYDQYLEAFKKGVYNVIKEDNNGDESIPRKYFSGGTSYAGFQPKYSSNVSSAVLDINKAGDELVSVAASAAESRDEQSTQISLSVGTNTRKLIDMLRKWLLTPITAIMISGNFSFAADFISKPQGPNQLSSIQMTVKHGDTWKSIVEQEFGKNADEFPGSSEDILKRSFEILKINNPGLTDLQEGATLDFTTVAEYLTLVNTIAHVDVLSVDTYRIGNESYPVYTAQVQRGLLPGLHLRDQNAAVSLYANGEILNVPALLLQNVVDRFGLDENMSPPAVEKQIERRPYFAGMTFREVLELDMVQAAHHELFHSYLRARLKQTAIHTERYEDIFAAVKKSKAYGKTVDELGAFLGMLALSPKPMEWIDEFAAKLSFTPSTTPRGEHYYYSSQIIMGILLEKLGYKALYVDHFLKSLENAFKRDLTSDERVKYTKAAEDVLLKNIRAGKPTLLYIDEFFASKTDQEITAAAAEAFENIFGMPIPRVDAIRFNPDVIAKVLLRYPEFSKLFLLQFDNEGRIIVIPDNQLKTHQLSAASSAVKMNWKEVLTQTQIQHRIEEILDAARPDIEFLSSASDGELKVRLIFNRGTRSQFSRDYLLPNVSAFCIYAENLYIAYFETLGGEVNVVRMNAKGFVSFAADLARSGNIQSIAIEELPEGVKRDFGIVVPGVKIQMDLNRNMTQSEIDRRIDQILGEDRPGIYFLDPSNDGDLRFKFKTSGIGTFDNVRAFSAHDKDVYVAHFESPENRMRFTRLSTQRGTNDSIKDLLAEELPEVIKKDFGIVSASSSMQQISSNAAPGGIDFDPSKLNLQIKRDGHGVPLPLPQQNLENINIKGLYPVIINIMPINAQTLPILSQVNVQPDVVLSKG